jgi:hypothetical protein
MYGANEPIDCPGMLRFVEIASDHFLANGGHSDVGIGKAGAGFYEILPVDRKPHSRL